MAPIPPPTHQPGPPDARQPPKVDQNDRPQEPGAETVARTVLAANAKFEQSLDNAEDWYRSMANIPNQNEAGELQLSSYFRHINWLYGDCAITHARPRVLAQLRVHNQDEPEMAITALTELGKVYYCREVELVSRFPRRFDPIQTSSSGFYATTLHQLTTFIVAETTRPMRSEIQYHSDITWINVADTARECHDALMQQSTQDLRNFAAALYEVPRTELSESPFKHPEQSSSEVNPKLASSSTQLTTETDRVPEPHTPVAEKETLSHSPETQQSSLSPSEPSPSLSPEFSEVAIKRKVGRKGSGHANEVILAEKMTNDETGMNNPRGACERCVQRFTKQWKASWKANHKKTEDMPEAPPVPADYCRVLKDRKFANSVRCNCCAVGHDAIAVCNVANALERRVLSANAILKRADAVLLWEAVMRLCNGNREAADQFVNSIPVFPRIEDYTTARQEIESGIRRGPTWGSINTSSTTTRSLATSKRKREAGESSTQSGRPRRKPRQA